MRITTWIKTTGILCIIFGAYGLINGMIEIFFLPKMLQTTQGNENPLPGATLQILRLLGYVKVAVSVVYLLAGIFFLIKKPFSVRLMYCALVISLIYGIVPMLFLRQYSIPPFVDYSFSFSNLVSPLIDVLLLIVVYRISKHYFHPPQDIQKGPASVWLTPRALKLWTLAGALCLLIPLSVFGLWFYVSGLDIPRLEKVERFKSFFPGFLQGNWATTYMSVIFSVFTILFSSLGLRLEAVWWRVLNVTLMTIGILSLLWNLFALM